MADFGALGRLNEAAVSGSRRAPHDAAAAAAGAGTAGVMAHVAGPLLPSRPAWAAWLEKPAGVAYATSTRSSRRPSAGATRAPGSARWCSARPRSTACMAAETVPLPWPLAHAWPLRPVVAAV